MKTQKSLPEWHRAPCVYHWPRRSCFRSTRKCRANCRDIQSNSAFPPVYHDRDTFSPFSRFSRLNLNFFLNFKKFDFWIFKRFKLFACCENLIFALFPTLDHNNVIAEFGFDWWVSVNWRTGTWNSQCKSSILKGPDHWSAIHPSKWSLILY